MPVTPKNAADDCIARARALLAHAGIPGTAAGVRDDLGRLALVMAVASVDTYMHTLILRRVSNVRSALPKALRDLDIEFEWLTELADSTVIAQRTGRATRPWVSVKHALQERLLRKTFQSYDEVAAALAMVGVKKAWSTVAGNLVCSPEEIKNRLNSIVHRRNQIVHEGDLRRMARPRAIQHAPIDLMAVQADIDWIDQLLAAIVQVAR